MIGDGRTTQLRAEMSPENQIHDVEVADEEQTTPLITHDFEPDKSSPSLPNRRLVSLDVFRGLTVAVRTFFSTTNHSIQFLQVHWTELVSVASVFIIKTLIMYEI